VTGREGELRLGRNRGWATAATAAIVGVGVILAVRGFRGSPAALVLGVLMVVAGILGYARAIRPWFLDDLGLSLAGNRRLLWADVTRIQVLAVTPEGAGKGPARVDLIIDTPQRTVRLLLVSRVDAAKVSALLERRLPQDIEGRELLWLINNAWAHNP
jgi:hypothetical protein